MYVDFSDEVRLVVTVVLTVDADRAVQTADRYIRSMKRDHGVARGNPGVAQANVTADIGADDDQVAIVHGEGAPTMQARRDRDLTRRGDRLRCGLLRAQFGNARMRALEAIEISLRTMGGARRRRCCDARDRTARDWCRGRWRGAGGAAGVETRVGPVATIRGEIRNRRSCEAFTVVSRRNKRPMPGTSPSTGTLVVSLIISSRTSPPSSRL